MTIVFQILLSLLPQLLKWLASLSEKKERLSGRQLDQMNRITFYAGEVSNLAPKVGCAVGGSLVPSARSVDESNAPKMMKTGTSVGASEDGAGSMEAVATLPDLARYRAMIDHAIGMFEAYARLTGETWDDNLSKTVRNLFESMFPGMGGQDPQEMGLSADGATPESTGLEAAADLPSWLVPLVLGVVKWLISKK